MAPTVHIASSSLKGQLYYPSPVGMNSPLNEVVADKIRDYLFDYNDRPSNVISFMSDVTITSDLLHCEFVCILFLQSHRETPLFC